MKQALPKLAVAASYAIGAGVQASVFFTFNAVDVFNFFLPDDLAFISLAIAVGGAAGAGFATLARAHLRCFSVSPASVSSRMVVGQLASGVLYVAGLMLAAFSPAAWKRSATLGASAVLLGLSNVLASVAADAFYGSSSVFFDDNDSKRIVVGGQAGGVAGFAMSFVIRAVTKAVYKAPSVASDVPPAHHTVRQFQHSAVLYAAVMMLVVVVSALAAWYLMQCARQPNGVASSAAATDLESSAAQADHRPLLAGGLDDVGNSDDLAHASAGTVLARDFWRPLVSIWAFLAVSNGVFPGLASQFHGTSSGWFVVISFGAFSVGDLAGKLLPLAPRVARVYSSQRTCLAHACCHVVVALPLLLVAWWHANTVAQSDAFAYVFLALLGVSNGLGICTSMALLNERVRLDAPYATGAPGAAGFAALQAGLLTGMAVGAGLSRV